MRIVFIGPFGWQPKATMRTRALGLGQALVKRGHTVTILLPPWDDPERAGQSWEEGGVQIINVTLPPGLPLLFHLLLTWKLVAQALALKPEVIHLFKPKAYAGLSHLALEGLRRLGGSRVRLVVDEDDWEQAWNEVSLYSAGQKRFFAWQEQWGLGHADAVTVASRALEQLVTAQRKNNPTGVIYLPNGCHEEVIGDWRPAAGSESLYPTILLYTRFVEFRLERIVTLVRAVSARLPQARWLIVGSGLKGEEKLLRIRLAEAKLTQYVRFTGWPVDDLPGCLSGAEVAIFPYDDTPINRTKCSVKLIDLLVAGVPVVADAVGQNVEYIRAGLTGILTPVEDDQAMAAALVALLQNPEQRQQLGQAARRHIEENFTWSYLAQTVEKAYYS